MRCSWSVPTATHYVHPANVRPEARDGLVLRLRLRVDEEVVVEAIEGVPLWTENNWLAHRREEVPHRIRIWRLDRLPGPVREERLPVIAAAVGEVVDLSAPRFRLSPDGVRQ